MDLWPLLTEDLLSGTHSVERQLRPHTTAVAVNSRSIGDVHDVVTNLCTRWAGAYFPLVPIDPDEAELDSRFAEVLLGSSIDGVEPRGLIPEPVNDSLCDRWGDVSQYLIHQLTFQADRPIIQTCRNIPTTNAWFGAYLVLFGDVPVNPDVDKNRIYGLRDELSFTDFGTINAVNAAPSVQDLLSRLRIHNRVSAVNLTKIRLPTAIGAGYNKGLQSTSRFDWGQSSAASKYGPNILVVYRPERVDDLSLAWNLRARFAHPNKLPLCIPLNDTTRSDIKFLRDSLEARHFFGFEDNFAVTSFSIPADELRIVCEGFNVDIVDPWELFAEVYGGCVASTEMVHFENGKATIACFSPTDIESLGQSYLGTSHATWLTLTATIARRRLPPSKTMRRSRWGDPGYLHGDIVHVGKLDEFRTVRHPSGTEVLRALSLDHSMVARVSTPGKAAENLMRAAGGELAMFAYPGVTTLFNKLTRRGHSSLVKRRLNQFLEGSNIVADSNKYDVLASRLDEALGTPEIDEVAYLNFNAVARELGIGVKPTAAWIDWAVIHRIVLRGIEARCKNCKHAQWRPLQDAIPELICHGCGLVIDTPFGSQKIDYQYRASEVLLRAMEHDTLPSILAIRHIVGMLDSSRSGAIFGAYPGVELLEPNGRLVCAEFDTVVILATGKWVVGECKTRQRGLTDGELRKLWVAADRVGAPTTFAATLDAGHICEEPWRRTVDDNGRPHFGLTASHLYDLAQFPPLGNDDFFSWRDRVTRFPLLPDAELTEEEFMAKGFENYLLARTVDSDHRTRAHWDVAD